MQQGKIPIACLAGLFATFYATGQPAVDLNSAAPPTDASIPPGAAGDPIKMLPFFDDYSWRIFLSMVWPAASGQRGIPDLSQTVASDGRPKVFETFKAPWEILHATKLGLPDKSPPAPWNQYDQPQYNACKLEAHFGDLVLASFSKFSDLSEAAFGGFGESCKKGSLCGPLVAQNRTYIHYLTGYNKTQFDRIYSRKFYAALAPDASFPDGAIDVKSAWVDMKGSTHPERFYTREAWVLEPDGACTRKTMGLIGLHVVQKTPHRQQWIWSSFEQVDIVPADPLGSPGPFVLYNSAGPDLGSTNPYPVPLAWPPPAPYSVQRLRPIHPSTQATNLAYRKALQAVGSVWQYYQLVLTQFPIRADQIGDLDAEPDYTFPGTNRDSTAFANLTMETLYQSNVLFSCMSCHRNGCIDFVCSLPARLSGNVVNLMMQPATSKKK